MQAPRTLTVCRSSACPSLVDTIVLLVLFAADSSNFHHSDERLNTGGQEYFTIFSPVLRPEFKIFSFQKYSHFPHVLIAILAFIVLKMSSTELQVVTRERRTLHLVCYT